MSIEAMKQWLEALELLVEERSSEAMDDGYAAITSLRQAIARAEGTLEAEKQEPVACGYDETTGNCTQNPCCYTHPQPKRESLTDEQITLLWQQTSRKINHIQTFARAIEAKLKEKNT